MPLYAFFCRNCMHHFDARAEVGILDYPCPKCTNKARRVFTPIPIHQKTFWNGDGEGFSSVYYHPDEYKERVQHNIPKYESVGGTRCQLKRID